MNVSVTGVERIQEVSPGDDLALLISRAAAVQGVALGEASIVAVAQKVVSKAENSIVDLNSVEPSETARAWAAGWGKDPRLVELVLRQSRRIVRMDRGVLVAETHHGLVTANAGVDQSNVRGEDRACLLPVDPDASAERLRIGLGCGAVLITDTFGRPWREGLVDVAIGVAGLEPLEDWRGLPDRNGRVMRGTVMAVADQLAAMAGLVMRKPDGVPVAVISGFPFRRGSGRGAALIRPAANDLFR